MWQWDKFYNAADIGIQWLTGTSFSGMQESNREAFLQGVDGMAFERATRLASNLEAGSTLPINMEYAMYAGCAFLLLYSYNPIRKLAQDGYALGNTALVSSWSALESVYLNARGISRHRVEDLKSLADSGLTSENKNIYELSDEISSSILESNKKQDIVRYNALLSQLLLDSNASLISELNSVERAHFISSMRTSFESDGLIDKGLCKDQLDIILEARELSSFLSKELASELHISGKRLSSNTTMINTLILETLLSNREVSKILSSQSPDMQQLYVKVLIGQMKESKLIEKLRSGEGKHTESLDIYTLVGDRTKLSSFFAEKLNGLEEFDQCFEGDVLYYERGYKEEESVHIDNLFEAWDSGNFIERLLLCELFSRPKAKVVEFIEELDLILEENYGDEMPDKLSSRVEKLLKEKLYDEFDIEVSSLLSK